jgi:hypothetical protein
MNNELQRMWKEMVVCYIKVLFQHLLGWSEENLSLTQSSRTGSAELTARTEMSRAKPLISPNSSTLTAGRAGFVGARRMAIST